jgi:hypothetical protein
VNDQYFIPLTEHRKNTLFCVSLPKEIRASCDYICHQTSIKIRTPNVQTENSSLALPISWPDHENKGVSALALPTNVWQDRIVTFSVVQTQQNVDTSNIKTDYRMEEGHVVPTQQQQQQQQAAVAGECLHAKSSHTFPHIPTANQDLLHPNLHTRSSTVEAYIEESLPDMTN